MPKTKKMTKKDLEYFYKLLTGLRIRVMGDLGQISGDYMRKNLKEVSGDLSGYSFHMADMASDATDAEFNLSLAENEQDLLKDIDDALKRVKDGTYGVCEKYNEPIPKERLKAIPWAKYSVKAQEEEEKGSK